MTTYVIIGGSAGAVGAVEGIRKLDPSGEISVVSEEPMAPYSRPAIGEYLDGRVDLKSVRFGSPTFWKENSVQLLESRKVTFIDIANKNARLDDGEALEYSKLLLAPGARPFVPKMDGTNKEGFHTFMNLNDVEKIRHEIPRSRRAVVIGGGLIGVEVAEALVNLGMQVTVVELRDWLLNLLIDKNAARIVESAMISRGAKLVVGQSVKQILGHEGDDYRVGGVILSSGAYLDCDLVISAVGVIPRTELAIQAGLKVNRGILVDRYMQTSASGVYACGDAAEAYELLGGGSRVFAIWPLARLGGQVAGENMAGGKVEYPGGVAMSSLRYFSVPVVSVGLDSQETTNEFEVLKTSNSVSYKKIVLRENQIIGFTLVREIEAAGFYHNLMRTKTDVSDIKGKLLSPDFSFAHLPEKVRKKTLMEAWA